MNQRTVYATLLLAVLGTTAYAADVYRSTAADGTVSYSDRPQGADAQFVLVTGATPRTPAQGSSTAGAGSAPEAPEAAAPPAPLPDEGPTAAQLRLERQKNCEIARERHERYTLPRRLFRTTAAGEREYLDAAAVAEAREKATADVQDWCS
jgi:hypothetical protein